MLKDTTREYVPLSDEGRKGFERYHAEMEYLVMQKAAKKERKEKKAAVSATTVDWRGRWRLGEDRFGDADG